LPGGRRPCAAAVKRTSPTCSRLSATWHLSSGCRLRQWSGGAPARQCSGPRAQHQPAPSQADAHQCPRPWPPFTPATPARSQGRVHAPRPSVAAVGGRGSGQG
jgi:hypothetical protein